MSDIFETAQHKHTKLLCVQVGVCRSSVRITALSELGSGGRNCTLLFNDEHKNTREIC